MANIQHLSNAPTSEKEKQIIPNLNTQATMAIFHRN
jgi:hypothetical protein